MAKPMVNTLINIDVPDIKAAELFYCGAFDLKVTRHLGEGAIELEGLGVPCYLLEKPAGSRPIPLSEQERDYARHWTPVHLDLTVQDIQAVYERALALGAKAESDIRTAPYGKIVLMSDPFGHGFCLIEFNELGYDTVTTEASN